MASEKNIKAFKVDGEEDNVQTKSARIDVALDLVGDLTRREVEVLVTKLNVAVMRGFITLSSQESVSLKSLSTKFIPDAPKQLNIQAEVKTEQVILGWLDTNTDLSSAALRHAASLAPEQEQSYAMLEGFSEEITGVKEG